MTTVEPGLPLDPPDMPPGNTPVTPVEGPYGPLYPDGYVAPGLEVPAPPVEAPVPADDDHRNTPPEEQSPGS